LWFLGFYQFQNHRTPQFSIFLLFFFIIFTTWVWSDFWVCYS
jgi:hypothetical protein